MKGLQIVSTGRCLADKIVTNEDMTHIIETTDEWIVSRTGIHERRYLAEGQCNADLAAEAARRAIAKAGISPSELCACVVATVSPDLLAPTMGCLVQKRLGLPEDIPCFDLNVGCSGFVYGLKVIRGLLAQDERPYALFVGSDALSTITDFQDRPTCILFADGAGAVIAKLDDKYFDALLCARCDGDAILIDGPKHPHPVIHMDGRTVFRFASEVLPQTIHQLVDRAGMVVEDIDWFVPHQANGRIIDHAAKRLGTSMDKWYVNIDHYGNTSAASIPIALDEMDEKGLLKRGQKVAMVGFGAGLTWAGALVEW